MFRKLMVLVAIGLLGCGGSKGSSNSYAANDEDVVIPEKVDLQEDQFPAITDAQFAEGKLLLGRLQSLNALREHILVNEDESDEVRQHRDEAYDRLSDSQKAAVALIRSKCEVTTEPEGANLLSTEFNIIEEIRTKGDSCTAQLSDRNHRRWTVISTDAKGESGVVRVFEHSVLHSAYGEDGMALAAGLRELHVETQARGRMEIEPDGSRTFTRVRGEGRAELLDLGHMDIQMHGDFLENDDSREIAMYVTLSFGGQSHVLAMHAKQNDFGFVSVDKFFIGNRELSATDRESSGADELARLLFN